jgi:hypothetical protein
VPSCATGHCFNGYALAITVPYSERERALARCFEIGDD